MPSEAHLKDAIAELKPALEACLDPVCVVDRLGRLVYLNEPMSALLGLKRTKNDLRFCDVVKLAVCKPACQVEDVLAGGDAVRFDETPASRGSEKFRLTVQVSPLKPSRKGGPIGALISARDVTESFLIQAKYLKALQLLERRDSKIAELEQKLAQSQ